MTLNQLGEKLREMYFGSGEGEAVAMTHLFGIKYAAEIKELGASATSIALAAGIQKTYGTEINKGIKLAKFVTIKP
jgi:5-methylcytosine-specific restriction protein B